MQSNPKWNISNTPHGILTVDDSVDDSVEEHTKLCDKKMIKYAQVTFARPSPEVVLSIFLGGWELNLREVSPVILKNFEVAVFISEKA